CSSKYLIESDKLQYHTSDTVRITVRGSTNDDTFRGILLVAKTKTSQQIIGTWSVVGSDIKTLNCGGIDNTGITHNSPSDKSSIEALWHPPSTIIEDSIVIKATIVQSFDKIYVDCFSITLTAKPTDTTTTVASRAPTHRSTTTTHTHHSTATPHNHRATTTPQSHHATTTPHNHRPTTTPHSHRATTPPHSHRATTTPHRHRG
ncbi:unnamed protein product, partial [Rotaria sordida]